ncbi:MAG: glutathione synthase [Hyphomicrobiaceae bacterium]|nr:glutathione synthase [Hyphomicrobiaceae bacterium]
MLKLAVQIDPLDRLNIGSDSSVALMAEGQSRGVEIHTYQPGTLAFESGRLSARLRRTTLDLAATSPFTVGPPVDRDLADFDVVFIRQDPPFDMAYYSNTYMLELLPPRVKVLNNPRAIRNTPEKLSALNFPHLMAPTLISHDPEAIRAFALQHGDIVLKPLSLFGGEMIVKSSGHDPALGGHIATLTSHSAEPIVAQKFLPGVATGDRRVMMLKGKPVGALGRLPPEGGFIANIHSGGKPVLATLTDREVQICAEVGPKLIAWDIFFAGLDLIDGHLSEINVTSPTLMQELRRVGGPDIAKLYWDELLADLVT